MQNESSCTVFRAPTMKRSGERTTRSRDSARGCYPRSCDTCRKSGPFKALAFNNPTPQTEDLYFKSINTTVDRYRAFLEEVRTNSLLLPNRDLDTGNVTKAAEYSLTDDTYAKLLSRLSERKFDRTTADLRDNILQFYSDLSAPIETKKDTARWQSVLASLDQLKLGESRRRLSQAARLSDPYPCPIRCATGFADGPYSVNSACSDPGCG